MNTLRRFLEWAATSGPVLLDVAAIGFASWGVFLLETSQPGWWAIVIGAGLFLAALRAQT